MKNCAVLRFPTFRYCDAGPEQSPMDPLLPLESIAEYSASAHVGLKPDKKENTILLKGALTIT